MTSTHLIWFCGTGETKEDVQHLFHDLPQGSYTIISGWGTGKYMSGERLFDWKAQLSGIDKNDAKKAMSGIKKNLKVIKSSILNQKITKLIVGGFSRGAAFFVPCYLKQLIDDENNPLGKIDKLVILLLDPVTGSAHDDNKNDVTESTMSSLKILSKVQLFDNIINQIRSKVYIISLIPGFDKRKANFRPDFSFISAMKLINKYHKLGKKLSGYTYRAGIDHGVFSTHSKNKASFPKIELDFGGFDKASFMSSDNIKNKFKELLKADLDLIVTRSLITNLFYSEKEKGQINLENLKVYQDTTDLVLGSTKKIYYDLGKIYWTGHNNDNYVSSGYRRLIQPTDKIDEILEILKSWHTA